MVVGNPEAGDVGGVHADGLKVDVPVLVPSASDGLRQRAAVQVVAGRLR
jgi:hypothetical protein